MPPTPTERYRRRLRSDRSTSVLPPHRKHGTRGTYNDGCRCDPCTDTEAAYWYERKARPS